MEIVLQALIARSFCTCQGCVWVQGLRGVDMELLRSGRLLEA